MDCKLFPLRQMARSVCLLFLFPAALLAGCAAGTHNAPATPGPGGVRGALTFEDGTPVSGAEVYFYTDPERKFRGPADFMAEPTGSDGRYIIELPPGEYFAVARKRSSGSISGGLQKGDYASGTLGPVTVGEGGYQEADLKLTEMTGNMLFSIYPGKSGGQGIRGVITDRDGRPCARAYAFAYKDPKMVGKPDYVSEWTREDGQYVIYVLEPGAYYVGARTGFMGVPRPDEPYGRYEGSRDHSVDVKDGEFTGGAGITLKRFSGSR